MLTGYFAISNPGSLVSLCRHYQSGLRLDPEHGELKKQYFKLKMLLRKSKAVSQTSFTLQNYILLIYILFPSVHLL